MDEKVVVLFHVSMAHYLSLPLYFFQTINFPFSLFFWRFLSACVCVFLVERLILNNLLWAYNIYGHSRDKVVPLREGWKKNSYDWDKKEEKFLNELSSTFVVSSAICIGGKASWTHTLDYWRTKGLFLFLWVLPLKMRNNKLCAMWVSVELKLFGQL